MGWRKGVLVLKLGPGLRPGLRPGLSLGPGMGLRQGLRLGLLVLLCCLALCPAPVQGDKVLVMPVDGSHWLSMKLLVKELAARGHEMVVLVPDTSILIQGSDYYTTETFRVPYSKAQLDENVNKLKDAAFLKAPDVMDIFVNVQHLVHFTTMQVKGCEGLLYDKPLMKRLRGERFQMMLTDPFLPCGSIIAGSFNIPAVYFSRGIPCGLDEKAAQCPTPPSYVPRLFSGNTDHMDFLGRVKNMLMYSLESYLCTVMFASFDELTSRYLEKDMTYRELLGHGAIWLLRYDYSFEYPKPRMPNMVNIGGINCGKRAPLPAVSLIRVCFRTNNFNCGTRAPLPAELQEFVDESGEDGFVVFTLGSMISQMPEEKAKQFFDAFSKIPQRVVWRYTGVVPENIPDNIRLMKWLPQNDLLGHPKVKAFITHGGTHGIYEGICNSVPMVMLPLFGDQSDNVHRMVVRGVGEVLTLFDITSEKLVEALNKVINDKSYKEKMLKLSAVHKDRPIEPLDLAVFWAEFVMRHGGAEHLRPAAHDLNWIQYHSLDVFTLLLTIVLIVVMVTVKCCKVCFRKCCGTKKTMKKKKE
ncbi:UDP-glucuronosyltransferase-like isoform X1 [Oncorhynchus keta]|uniref:UDP-glucuronosyltransferase-like isoform X1 n=1 Tax=Oncorhynchus keta TaxID=8018 RepID=UPI00227BD02E|nr:UDP-glucuronosyltransferase-like isoform X1 [Oncorhynchus keta]